MAATAHFDTVDNITKLNEDDFRDVTEEIRGLHSEFYAVGRELGIRASDLDSIKRDSSLSYEDKLNQVVLLWLREGYNVNKFGIPTWRRLVDAVNRIRPALAKDVVRHLQARGRTETRVAVPSTSHIKAPHRCTECDILQQFHADLNLAITDPDVFAANLVQYQFMSQQAANSIVNVLGVSKYQMVGRLLGVVDAQLKTAGEHVGAKFKVFLSILDVALGLRDLSEQMLKCYGSSQPPKTQVFNPSDKVENHSAGTIGTTPATTTGATSIGQGVEMNSGVATPAAATQPGGQCVEMNPVVATPAATQPGAGAAPPQLTFSVDMTNDDFITFMKNKGLYDKDALKLTENCIGAKVFLELTDEDINHPSLGFSFGGKKVINKVLKTIKETETPVTHNMMPSVSIQQSPTTNATLPTIQHQPNSSASGQTPQPGPYRRLRDQDHNVIYTKLAPHAANWKELGTALGFDDNELELIQNEPLLLMQSPRGYLRKLLSQWLQWGPRDGRRSTDFANSVAIHEALLSINLAPVAYELDKMLHKSSHS